MKSEPRLIFIEAAPFDRDRGLPTRWEGGWETQDKPSAEGWGAG